VAVTTPSAYAARFDERVATLVVEAAARVDAFADRLEAAGLSPAELVDTISLDRLPVLSKDDLLELQAARPPFGGLVADGPRPRRIFQSPGPLYEVDAGGSDPWRFAPALRAAGFGADDIVLNAFGYHLSPAGAMVEEAVFALGATVVPAGVGSMDLQARACRDLGVTAYVGLPSYLKALLENAHELGLEPEQWPLARAFVTAEPLTPSLRAWLEERVSVRQAYGTAECGCLGYECDEKDGLHVPDDALVQVCDLTTGVALWDGSEGEVVATLFSPDRAVVRFGTGDLSAYLVEPCRCGRDTPRIAGWLGRVGEAVKVRGMFLHPRQAHAALAGVEGLDGFRLVVERVDHRDVLRCEIRPVTNGDSDALVASVRERIRSGLRFQADVEVVPELDPEAPPIVDLRTWE
jgi:phenylacetate-CoA ligase